MNIISYFFIFQIYSRRKKVVFTTFYISSFPPKSKSSKSILEYNVLEGYDRQITKLEKYSKYNLAFRQEIEKLCSEKNNSLKLLENDQLLKFYLDDEVRKNRMQTTPDL